MEETEDQSAKIDDDKERKEDCLAKIQQFRFSNLCPRSPGNFLRGQWSS